MRRMIPAVERVMAKVTIEDRGFSTPCWVWNGALTRGYGFVQTGSRLDGSRRPKQVYRVTYEAATGLPFPEGLDPDHLCRVKACCNPAHIEPVTRAENIRRGAAPAALRKYYAAMTHCRAGHEYNDTNTRLRPRPNGFSQRVCRVCQREWNRRAAEAARDRQAGRMSEL